ncbi:MAG: PEP-CTERM sorting domain-containing protein [Armatimonadetes bacterium]|nr:PEP-CTERM sorting domain-containing protein [Armatimonadota bacterium]
MRGLCLAALFVAGSAVWATPKYEIKEYISVAGAPVERAYAAYNGELNFGGGAGTAQKSYYRKNGVITDLTAKFNVRNIFGSGISSSGMALTYIPNEANPDYKGGYIQGDTLHTIPSKEPVSWIIPKGINDSGIVVGYTHPNSTYDHTNSFIYNTVTGDRLDFRIATFTKAYGINNSGDIAASFSFEGGQDGNGGADTAILHTKTNTFTILGPGSPREINERGQIASIRFGSGFSWYQEGREPITKEWLEYSSAQITGLGNDGLIVGRNDNISIFRGFVATPTEGAMYLDEIVSNLPANKYLTDPILDRANGDIYASLSNANGTVRQVVRLQAVPEPMTLVVVGLGLATIVRRRRVRA